MHTGSTASRVPGRKSLTVAVAALAALSLAGCGVTVSPASPTAQAGGITLTGATPSSGSSASAGGATSTASASPGSGDNATGTSTTAGPTPEPTAAQWKTYKDPGSNVSFDLPADWITQLVPAKAGKGIHVEVRDGSGTVVATLQTQITGLGGACPPKSARPYTVLSSIPLQIPSNNKSASAVAPRYVYRVIQGGTHFYASYGITDQAAGADGKACLVYNTVQSKQLGVYMFGDVLQFTSALDGSAGLRAFATISDAQAYMRTSSYRNIERMVTSLKALH